MKKWISLLLCVLTAMSLSACTIPSPGFADYDVSGYIQALLDSSYHGENQDLVAVAAITEEEAGQYNATTVENAAVTFCNIYGISPSDQQLEELQKIMKRAFELTKYTVKDERKVDTGYYLEVEIAPVTNFAGREAEIEELREEARQEATAAQNAAADGKDANSLFVDKVLEFCIQELANISYDQDTRTIALNIRQTEAGELQLDLNQIDTIDQTVVRFE